MVALKIETFGGMVPRADPHLLSDNMAELTDNAWLQSGALEPMREPKQVYTCSSSAVTRVFRVPLVDAHNLIDSHWLEFINPDVEVIRNPTADDVYDRYYWAGEDGLPPMYNTRARILNNDPAFKLGIPTPLAGPTVTPPAGGTPISRAYVVTYVSAYGEEGAPSDPTSGTGDSAGTWTIGLPVPTAGQTANRNITRKYIYRTITSSAGVATYFFVADVPIAQTTFSDNIPDTTVSGNNELQSMFWTEPPSDLKGWIPMPNGMVVAFRGEELWFCEPYRLHAWPVSYTLTTNYPIVGLGVLGQTVFVMTEVHTYAATGVNPAAMTMSTISRTEPITSRGSIVNTQAGVLYSSTNGLILATPAGTTNVTDTTIGKDNWNTLFQVERIRAAKLGTYYYCFGRYGGAIFQSDAFQNDAFQVTDYKGSQSGAMIGFTDPRLGYLGLSSEEPTGNVFNDMWTDEVLVLREGKVFQIDISETQPYGTYRWRSKIFQTPKVDNFEAVKIFYRNPNNDPTATSVLYTYADGRLVSTRTLPKSGEMMRLPSGFKADFWQFEVEGKAIIYNIQIATSARELLRV